MKHVSLLVVALSSCAGSGPVEAQVPAQPLVGEMQRLSFYVGDWTCEGTQLATADAPEERWTAEIHVRPEAGGSWLSVRMVGPGDNVTSELKGYDVDKRQWVHLWAASGGYWGSLRSEGWQGDQMISYDDDPATGGKNHRAVFTKLSETRYSHRDEVDNGSGFQGVWEKVCEKK